MKKLILDAALDLYLHKGLAFTTIRKIAEKIDYSPTTIYLYYPSKDLIFYDMQKLAFESLHTTLRSVDADKDPVSRLNNLGRTYIDFGIENPEKYDLMFLLNFPMNAIASDQPWCNFQQTYDIMQSTVKECIAEKRIIYSDASTGPLQFWSFLHGLTSLYLKNRLSHFCGTDPQSLKPVYQACVQYLKSIRVDAGY